MQAVCVGGDEVGEPKALLVLRQVRRDGPDVAELRQLLLGVCAGVSLARADHHAGACLQQPPRHHQADPPGATGDKRILAGQIEKLCVSADLVVCHDYGFCFINAASV